MENQTVEMHKQFLGFYDNHSEAEQAVIRLQENDCDIENMSIVAINLYSTERVLGFYNLKDKVRSWAGAGAFWAGFWGFLFGFSTYSVPFIGPLLFAGPIGAILTGIGMAIIGAFVSALAAVIAGIFASKYKKLKYDTKIKAGKYMLLSQSSDSQIERARTILHAHVPKERYEAQDWRVA